MSSEEFIKHIERLERNMSEEIKKIKTREQMVKSLEFRSNSIIFFGQYQLLQCRLSLPDVNLN